jgi:hypothetical protein
MTYQSNTHDPHSSGIIGRVSPPRQREAHAHAHTHTHIHCTHPMRRYPEPHEKVSRGGGRRCDGTVSKKEKKKKKEQGQIASLARPGPVLPYEACLSSSVVATRETGKDSGSRPTHASWDITKSGGWRSERRTDIDGVSSQCVRDSSIFAMVYGHVQPPWSGLVHSNTQ